MCAASSGCTPPSWVRLPWAQLCLAWLAWVVPPPLQSLMKKEKKEKQGAEREEEEEIWGSYFEEEGWIFRVFAMEVLGKETKE